MIDIIAELKAAEEATRFEFSQSDWEDALIIGFRHGLSMGGVLKAASGISRWITKPEWDLLQERASTLKPAVSQQANMKTRARVWIANHASHANNALWDMNYVLAKRLLKKGGVRTSRGVVSEITAENRKNKGRVFVSARQLDKRSDWNTVK